MTLIVVSYDHYKRTSGGDSGRIHYQYISDLKPNIHLSHEDLRREWHWPSLLLKDRFRGPVKQTEDKLRNPAGKQS